MHSFLLVHLFVDAHMSVPCKLKVIYIYLHKKNDPHSEYKINLLCYYTHILYVFWGVDFTYRSFFHFCIAQTIRGQFTSCSNCCMPNLLSILLWMSEKEIQFLLRSRASNRVQGFAMLPPLREEDVCAQRASNKRGDAPCTPSFMSLEMPKLVHHFDRCSCQTLKELNLILQF